MGYRDGFSERVLEASPMPSRTNTTKSRMASLPAKAGPTRDGGNTSGIMYFKRKKVNEWVEAIAVREE